MTRQEHAASSALWSPLFDELSDPVAVARLAAEAEEAIAGATEQLGSAR